MIDFKIKPGNLLIREARPGDAEEISNLVRELSEKFITQEFTAGGTELLLATMQPEAIRKYIHTGYKYHIAETGEKIIGVVGIKGNSHLYHLFVAEKYQYQGIARRLWQVAMESCLSNGNSGEFSVNSSNYARGVYEKLGFVAQSGPEEKNGVIYIPMKLEESPCQKIK
jgi:ribosomal protein S18 acetylase RimI-like enzyme